MTGRFAVFPMLGLALVLAAACTSAPTTSGARQQPAGAPGAGRTLVIMSGAELPSFAYKPLQQLPNPRAAGKEILNANLVYIDERGLPRPFLAEALPELNTSTWLVLPDGRMETTYQLRPNLTWHDGTPLSAEDFAFAWRVYGTPELGVAEIIGFRAIEDVSAPDPRTVVIRWKDRYAEAGQVVGSVLAPLPRHLLEQPYQERQGESFIGLPFWTSEYVGAGPWKLDRREAGAFFEATAFAGFVFGRPKIERIRVIYQSDSNTAVANMLSGEAHYSVTALLHGEEGLTLERAWATNNGGKVIWETDIAKGQEIQMRPEFAVPTQLATDVRVRQALAFAIDRATLTEVITIGKGLLREIYTHPQSEHYETVLRAVTTRYAYDPRRVQQLLEEAAFTRGSDGFWLTPTGERFTLEQWYLAGATNERDSVILVDTFRRLGIDASSNVFGIQRASNEERVKSPGMFGGSLGFLPDRYHSREIARADNRWLGRNRFGFSHPDLDRFIEAYNASLDRSERIQNLAQMERVAMEQLPAIPTYYTAVVIAHAATLTGVLPNAVPEAGEERGIWNWAWQS
jgi:peptide/nickel transport system substrate-binding protein